MIKSFPIAPSPVVRRYLLEIPCAQEGVDSMLPVRREQEVLRKAFTVSHPSFPGGRDSSQYTRQWDNIPTAQYQSVATAKGIFRDTYYGNTPRGT